jgi:Na+-translocating ferredoxin:NAD+ oxidoreductase RnfG subunit
VNFRFLLVPIAAVAGLPASATVYLTVEQAQILMFPGASFTKEFRTLSAEQVRAIEKASDVSVRNREVMAWRASTGGWFIVDEVVGKHEFIPLALALDESGAVKDVEILEYREAYGDQVREPAWRAQFTGKKHGARLKLNQDIMNISGATLSSRHVTDGVKRLLATYDIVLAASAR